MSVLCFSRSREVGKDAHNVSKLLNGLIDVNVLFCVLFIIASMISFYRLFHFSSSNEIIDLSILWMHRDFL